MLSSPSIKKKKYWHLVQVEGTLLAEHSKLEVDSTRLSILLPHRSQLIDEPMQQQKGENPPYPLLRIIVPSAPHNLVPAGAHEPLLPASLERL